ncbi:MAG: hypothetical protein M3N19_01060 [Candidatus Eremiobacteraeota bacterium]|nr:hypothetical protein [Candidatus Eremiobacteraeota bacterium]
MNIRTVITAIVLLSLAACGGGGGSSSAPPTSPIGAPPTGPIGTPPTGPIISATQRTYNGTASVGDFLITTINATAQTLSYVNKSNGDTATVPYTVNADGTLALADPTGNLVAAYEVPGYALLIEAQKTGPTHSTPSLITAVVSGPISLATLSAQTYNYMQFRTSVGGIEVGSVAIDAAGNITGSGYWPLGAFFNNTSAFHIINNPVTGLTADPSGTFLKGNTTDSTDYIFGTANGQFIVDTTNGAILGLGRAATKAFDPNNAGTYTAMLYSKTNATTATGNIESGTVNLGIGKVTLDTTGNLVIKDAQGNTQLAGLLVPIADAAYLNGPGQLVNPGNGLFTVRNVVPGVSQQDIFVSFQGRAMLFASFSSALPMSGSNPYNYAYGAALH